MSSVHAVPPPIPTRPPQTPLSPTYVQMPPPLPPVPSASSASSFSRPASTFATSPQSAPPVVLHANSYPSSRTFDYSDYSDVVGDLQSGPFAPQQPVRAASSSLPSRYSHSHRPHHKPHGMSAEDRALALMLQREEESRVSEEAIRVGLTQQFAKAAGRPVDEVDLSNLTLEEAQQAIEIQMKIKADKKKKGMLGGLKARFKLNSKQRKNKSNTSPTASSSSGSHLSVSASADGGRRSPSPSPLPANVDVDAMSYEELLALSEAIGDVKSKGMSESEIERLPTAVWERKRAEGEPEEQPVEEEQAEAKAMEGGGAADVSEDGKVKAKKKRGFFARIRGSSKQRPPLSSPPLPPLSSLPVPPLASPPVDDGKSEKPAASGVSGGVDQWRDTCSVCLEPFHTGELIKFLPCFHHFHAEELDNWLMVNASCPICKQKPTVH